MFEDWAEQQIAAFRHECRDWVGIEPVIKRIESRLGLLALVLDFYREEGPNVALEWTGWFAREADNLTERWLMESCARLLEEELSGSASAVRNTSEHEEHDTLKGVSA